MMHAVKANSKAALERIKFVRAIYAEVRRRSRFETIRDPARLVELLAAESLEQLIDRLCMKLKRRDDKG